MPPAAFHRELHQWLTEAILAPEGHRLAIAAPRESAKSTIITLFLPLWCILYPELAGKRFIIIASDTAIQAERHIADLRIELEANPRIRASFPESCGPGPVWTKGEIVSRSGVRVVSRGTGGNIRGLRHHQWRPDLLIGDDLENDTNSQSREQREKIENWFNKAFSKSAASHADILVIGTLLHYDSLLARLLANPAYEGRKYRGVIRWSPETALWEEWKTRYTEMSLPPGQRFRRAQEFFKEHQAAMTRDTEVIWPAHRGYLELMQLRVAEGPASFDSEIQNEPVNPADCLFREEWFQWFEEDEVLRSGLECVVAAVDPSLGKDSHHGDPSAIVVLGRDRHGALWVLEADICRRPPSQLIEDTLELYLRRRPRVIGVESVQFQEFFKDVLLKEAQGRGLYPPVRGVVPGKNKQARISCLQPLVKNGTLRFQRRHHELYDQLRLFPKAGHDDGPDALEMALALLEAGVAGRPRFGAPRTADSHLTRVFG